MAPVSCLVLTTLLSLAQRPDQAAALQSSGPWPSAERYEPLFDALQKIAPRSDRVATVRNLVLRRDAIEFHLEQGHPLESVLAEVKTEGWH